MVRQRSTELETGGDWKRGVEGLEKNPNLEVSLGLGVGFVLSCLISLVSRSLGIDVQKALRHPKTIVSALILVSFFSFSAFCCLLYVACCCDDIDGIWSGKKKVESMKWDLV